MAPYLNTKTSSSASHPKSGSGKRGAGTHWPHAAHTQKNAVWRALPEEYGHTALSIPPGLSLSLVTFRTSSIIWMTSESPSPCSRDPVPCSRHKSPGHAEVRPAFPLWPEGPAFEEASYRMSLHFVLILRFVLADDSVSVSVTKVKLQGLYSIVVFAEAVRVPLVAESDGRKSRVRQLMLAQR